MPEEPSERFMKVLNVGTTPEGRTMIALVVSKDRAFTPEAAAKTGKAIIMIQSGIRSAEIEGKDTALMLVRDMAVTRRFAGWLDHLVFPHGSGPHVALPDGSGRRRAA